MLKIYEDKHIYIELEPSEIPWLKIFTKVEYKEITDCDKATKKALFKALLICEKELRDYFNPTKINIASFGNYLQRVHFHIQARFQDDPYFPESMWGLKQRDAKLELKPIDKFCEKLQKELKN